MKRQYLLNIDNRYQIILVSVLMDNRKNSWRQTWVVWIQRWGIKANGNWLV